MSRQKVFRVLWEYVVLTLACFIFAIACLVYGHQLRESHRHAQERLDYLRKKKAVRQQLKSHK